MTKITDSCSRCNGIFETRGLKKINIPITNYNPGVSLKDFIEHNKTKEQEFEEWLMCWHCRGETNEGRKNMYKEQSKNE